MNATEIILLILGFLSICISFFLGSREETGEQSEAVPEARARDVWTEKEEEMVKGRIQSILEEEKEEVLAVTKDLLNRRSNEKIIEFDEFAKPLLEKIHHNHEEVVFMYNMLTEKEKKWKEAAAKRRAKKTAPAPVPSAEVVPVQAQKPSAQSVSSAPAPEPRIPEPPKPEPKAVAASIPVIQETEQPEKKPEVKATEKEVQKAVPKAEPKREPEAAVEETGISAAAKKADEVNKQIVALHKQGKSVLDISKELGVGQGEVKLTIALYGGNK